MSDDLQRQQAFLLGAIQNEPGQTTTLASLRKKVTKKLAKELGLAVLNIESVLEPLVQAGYLEKNRAGSSTTFKMTESGLAHYRELPPHATFAPLVRPDIAESLEKRQKAFLLLVVFKTKHDTMTRAELNRILMTKRVREPLDFGWEVEHPTSAKNPKPHEGLMAWLLGSLVKEKLLLERKKGVSVAYQLTDEGLDALAAAVQYETVEFDLTGAQLNKLIAAAREHFEPEQQHDQKPEPEPTQPEPVSTSKQILTAEDVLTCFENLRREQFARYGIVPIHALRSEIGAHFGENSARHEILDPLLKQMRRDRQIRLVALGDPEGVTSEQIQASIPGENETFFYLENAHESVPV